MLRIKRIKALVQTEDGNYEVDEVLESGVNFIASNDNTCGKSSMLDIIYYCLGLEQIIGGVGEKTLTSVYKTILIDGGTQKRVRQSDCFLELSNGEENITIHRAAKSFTRKNNLITVYYGTFDAIDNTSTLIEDMYVNMRDSATNKKGFHHFLEKFLHLNLPIVPTSDGAERKLYLQLIFASMFIEQKRGWGGILAGLPYLGIADAKKRVIEFVLGLETISNERMRSQLKNDRIEIENEWKLVITSISKSATQLSCKFTNLPQKPITIEKPIELKVVKVSSDNLPLDAYIDRLNAQYKEQSAKNPKVGDNFEELQDELNDIEKSINLLELEQQAHSLNLAKEKISITTLEDDLEVIKQDIKNNKDVAKLRSLGSSINPIMDQGICPLCNQELNDSLLIMIEDGLQVMNIDENIRHLEAQKEMLDYALQSRIESKESNMLKFRTLEKKLNALRRLAKSLRNDLYAVDEDLSESVVYRKIELENEIEFLGSLIHDITSTEKVLTSLAERWKTYLAKLEKLPKKYYTEKDLEKITFFQSQFKSNLKKYGYKSAPDIEKIEISKETYLPTIEGFDMKYDSSASDNIRSIWAFTIALFQTSQKYEGNHPGSIILDEPRQHSIVLSDLKELFDSSVGFDESAQVIIGITAKEQDTQKIIAETNPRTVIALAGKAFKRV